MVYTTIFRYIALSMFILAKQSYKLRKYICRRFLSSILAKAGKAAKSIEAVCSNELFPLPYFKRPLHLKRLIRSSKFTRSNWIIRSKYLLILRYYPYLSIQSIQHFKPDLFYIFAHFNDTYIFTEPITVVQ